MINYLALIVSILIASVAAWFSIAGLVTIFSASAIAIAIMASALEIGKLVTASWLYRNWKIAGFLLKTYLTLAVIVLMFITSIGIYGYLSKAHIDQVAPTASNQDQIERIDSQIDRLKSRVEANQAVLSQLDDVIQVLIQYDKISGPTGANQVREDQQPKRDELNRSIDLAYSEIDKLESKKYELTKQVRELEVEVGPIKYIAELIYEDPESSLDNAVRLVTLIIVFVFDPLAVILLIAANQGLVKSKESSMFDRNRIARSLESEMKTAPQGMTREQKRAFMSGEEIENLAETIKETINTSEEEIEDDLPPSKFIADEESVIDITPKKDEHKNKKVDTDKINSAAINKDINR